MIQGFSPFLNVHVEFCAKWNMYPGICSSTALFHRCSFLPRNATPSNSMWKCTPFSRRGNKKTMALFLIFYTDNCFSIITISCVSVCAITPVGRKPFLCQKCWLCWLPFTYPSRMKSHDSHRKAQISLISRVASP